MRNVLNFSTQFGTRKCRLSSSAVVPGNKEALDQILEMIQERDERSHAESVRRPVLLRPHRAFRTEFEKRGPQEWATSKAATHWPCGNCSRDPQEERGAHRPKKRKHFPRGGCEETFVTHSWYRPRGVDPPDRATVSLPCSRIASDPTLQKVSAAAWNNSLVVAKMRTCGSGGIP